MPRLRQQGWKVPPHIICVDSDMLVEWLDPRQHGPVVVPANDKDIHAMLLRGLLSKQYSPVLSFRRQVLESLAGDTQEVVQ